MAWQRAKDFVLQSLTSWVSIILVALCLAIAGYFLVRAWFPQKSISPQGTLQQGLVVPWVEVEVAKEYVAPPKKIRTYNKIQLSGTLKIPELEKEPGLPIAVASVPSHNAPTTTIAMLDEETGEARILTRQEKRKFFELSRTFGVRAGFGTGNLILAEAYARPVRLGGVVVEVRAFGKRTDRDGTDFGVAILADYTFGRDLP